MKAPAAWASSSPVWPESSALFNRCAASTVAWTMTLALPRSEMRRAGLCKPAFRRVGWVFHAESDRFSPSDSCRRQRYPLLAPFAPRPRQAGSGARWRALHDSADRGAAEARWPSSKRPGSSPTSFWPTRSPTSLAGVPARQIRPGTGGAQHRARLRPGRVSHRARESRCGARQSFLPTTSSPTSRAF